MAPRNSGQPAPRRTSKRSKRQAPYENAHQQHTAAARTSRLPAEGLSPAKRRIADALAALLVAHYRRQQERAERERVPGA